MDLAGKLAGVDEELAVMDSRRGMCWPNQTLNEGI